MILRLFSYCLCYTYLIFACFFKHLHAFSFLIEIHKYTGSYTFNIVERFMLQGYIHFTPSYDVVKCNQISDFGQRYICTALILKSCLTNLKHKDQKSIFYCTDILFHTTNNAKHGSCEYIQILQYLEM